MAYSDRLDAGAEFSETEYSTTESDPTVTITSDDGLDAVSFVHLENNTWYFANVNATSSGGLPITYSIVGGADAALFEINANSGEVRFAFGAAPNYEAPTDADGNNSYQVIVAASDGVASDQQAMTVNVYNVNETPILTSHGGASSVSLSITENTVIATSISAVDVDSPPSVLTYAIAGGADAAKFIVNARTGLLTFRSVPNYEAPADAGANNVYDVIVRATDQNTSVNQTFAITVTDAAAESSFTGTLSSNTIAGTAASDTIMGLDGSDTLSGLGGDDVIDGGAQNDTIVGGAGADQLLGGLGADRFRYDDASESAVGSHDVIFDFSRSHSDRISLTAVDANSTIAGDQNFTFVGANAFTGVAGQLRYEYAPGNTHIYGDLDGDAVADFHLQLNGEVSLYSSDFLL